MKNILLIVDPQNDFITGTLPVEGAAEKMMKLTEYIHDKGNNYDYILITLDSHPKDHCSFKDNGGIWPEHCVQHQTGWLIPSYLEMALRGRTGIAFYNKGDVASKEEYSIFENEEDGYTLTKQLNDIIQSGDNVFIDVCGIAGDYCVLETLKGLSKIIGTNNISVLSEFTASIDGGTKLNSYLENTGINNIIDSSLNLQEYVR